ncbi:MAG: hypothetical protein QF828_03470 [Pseudomonadales bacterium]|jgi:hypothetical protein|nr:hypothetical protein [Pseudomonadales bacterium]
MEEIEDSDINVRLQRLWKGTLFVGIAGLYVESAHKVVKKVKTPSRSQPTRKLGSSCTNLTI